MFKNQLTPRMPINISRPVPGRQNPGMVYGMRAAEFSRIMQSSAPRVEVKRVD